MAGPPEEDPGWGSLGKLAFGLLLPGLATRRAASAPNMLVVLRSLFLSFVTALVLFGVVLLFIFSGSDTTDPTIAPGVAAAAVAVVGSVLVVGSWTIKRQLPCVGLGELLSAYRTRLFLRVALAETSALLGFVASFLSESPLPYGAGLVPAAIGFARLAPTRANLQREDEALLAQGCPHSLYGGLLQTALGPQD